MSSPVENNQEQPAVDVAQVKADNLGLQRRMYEKQLQEERREKEELNKRIAELESAKRSTRNHDVDDDDDGEPYVDKKALKRQLERFSRDIGQDIDKRAEEKARTLMEQERQNNFIRANPDFGQILNEDLVQKFAEKHPEIAEPMLEMPDNFARKKLLYQNIKALGLHKPEVKQPTIQETVDKNKRNPFYLPTQSGGTPPYAAVGDFSKEGQKNAYERMQKMIAAKRS